MGAGAGLFQLLLQATFKFVTLLAFHATLAHAAGSCDLSTLRVSATDSGEVHVALCGDTYSVVSHFSYPLMEAGPSTRPPACRAVLVSVFTIIVRIHHRRPKRSLRDKNNARTVLRS